MSNDPSRTDAEFYYEIPYKSPPNVSLSPGWKPKPKPGHPDPESLTPNTPGWKFVMNGELFACNALKKSWNAQGIVWAIGMPKAIKTHDVEALRGFGQWGYYWRDTEAPKQDSEDAV